MSKEPRFVQRDKSGKVIGHYANPHDYATECVPEDHPDILDYKARVEELKHPSPELHIAGTFRRSPFARGLIRLLANKFGVAEAELLRLIAEAASTPDELKGVLPTELVKRGN